MKLFIILFLALITSIVNSNKSSAIEINLRPYAGFNYNLTKISYSNASMDYGSMLPNYLSGLGGTVGAEINDRWMAEFSLQAGLSKRYGGNSAYTESSTSALHGMRADIIMKIDVPETYNTKLLLIGGLISYVNKVSYNYSSSTVPSNMESTTFNVGYEFGTGIMYELSDAMFTRLEARYQRIDLGNQIPYMLNFMAGIYFRF